MYLKYFGLTAKPFELTPDPRFLFLTPGHREALAQLTYGVQERKGFILISGEVGTGKTTLLRTLIERLDRQVESAFVVNSTLPFDEMLEYVLADLGIEDPKGTRAQRLIALNRFLISQHRLGRTTVLIIDEAQNLSIEALEQIRLMSNFETSSAKLLQIILAGQPELHAKLQLAELRQLRQRIALRCVLQPMIEAEVEQYILSHLRIAGARRQIFTPSAMKAIAEYSNGIPRVVNMIGDHALLYGYADQASEIDADIVKRTVKYIEAGEVRRRFKVGRPSIPRYSMRTLVACSAGTVAVAAAIAGSLSSAYGAAVHGVAATTVAAIGGVVRLLTHWWGS